MKILFTFGIPDSLIGQVSAEQIQAGVALPGNMPIMAALSGPLQEQGWEVQYAYLGQPTELDIEGVNIILNCICDASIQCLSVTMLQELAAKTGIAVLNPASRIASSTRDQLTHFAGKGATIPRTSRYSVTRVDFAEHLYQHGHTLPVLVRPIGEHGSHGLRRIQRASDFQSDAETSDYFITDFVDFVSADGLYRKYRMIYVAGQMLRRHLMIGTNWLLDLKSRQYMQNYPELINEEKAFLAGDGEDAADALAQLFARSGLDFGVVDYAMDAEGRPTVFEMNACFQITGTITDDMRPTWGYLEASNLTVIEAFIERIVTMAKPDNKD